MELRGKDRLDQWLDRALQQYGDAEPRAGLESRILTNLAAEKDGLPALSRRWWPLGAAATVVIAMWLGSSTNRHNKAPVHVASNAVNQGSKAQAPLQPKATQPIEAATRRRARTHRTERIELARAPKLAQFPSPQPLSKQEQLLVRYVKEFPQEAVMIAQEQAEFEKEIEKLDRDNAADTHSDQQER